MVDTCLVTGTIVAPDGTPLRRTFVLFQRTPKLPFIADDASAFPAPVTVRTDADGSVEVELVPGAYLVKPWYSTYEPFRIVVPDEPAARLEDIQFSDPPPPLTDAERAVLDAREASNEAIAAAGTATTAAEQAETARSGAEEARQAAETARDAAQLNARIFPTTAAGLAATTDGDYFSVPSSDDDEYLILYRNDSGSATEVQRYPSVSGVEARVREEYAKRGRPTPGTSTGTFRSPGAYFLAPASNYEDLPADVDPSASYWLLVHNSGNSAGEGLDRFTFQELLSMSPDTVSRTRPRWTRRVDNNNPQNTGGLNIWTREDSSPKRGAVENGENLSNVREPGAYYLRPDGGYGNLPETADPTRAYWLVVHNTGGTTGGLDRWGLQELVAFDVYSGQRRVWRRRTDSQNPDSTVGNNAWAETIGEVSAQNLAPAYRAHRSLGEGDDLDGIVDDGLYVITAPVDSAPPDAMVGALLNVRVFGSFVSQTYHSVTDPLDGWSRTFRPGINKNDWVPLRTETPPPTDAPLTGKSIVAFGDSITEASNRPYKWPALFASRTGASVVNGGFGGCRMAVHDSPTFGHLYDPMCMYRLSERIANQDWQVLIDAAQDLYDEQGDDNRPQAAALANTDWSSVDYAIIFYGTNDFSSAVPIGGDSDDDGTTFKGAINYTVGNILSTYPHIKVVFVTPLWRARVGGVDEADSNVTPNSAGVYLREYAEAIKERAAAYQMPVIDLHANSGINILNWQTFMPDGLHPYPEEGMRRVADTIAGGFLAATW